MLSMPDSKKMLLLLSKAITFLKMIIMTYLCWISQHIFITLFFENYKDMNNAHY